MKADRLRPVLRSCGLLVSALALVWIGFRFSQGDGIAMVRRLPITPVQLVATLLFGALTYAIAMCLPATAWWRLLVGLSPKPPPAPSTLATYAVTQYGKYLPGNVAHYALRHAWSRRYGIPHESLGMAAALEAALLLLAAFSLTLLADARGQGIFSFLNPRIVIALLLSGLLALWLALHWIRRRGGGGRLHVPALPPSMLLAATTCYAGFFVLCAILLDGFAHMLDIDADSFARLLAASAASWLAGFIIIGAPAGLGVREATFVALTGAQLGEGEALLLISLFRVATFLGDTVFLAAGALSLRLEARRSSQRGV